MRTTRGGRPQGPERLALWDAAMAFEEMGQAATFAQLAERAKVGRAVARFTCWAMVKAGQLKVSEYVRLEGVKRPVAAFRPVLEDHEVDAGGALSNIMMSWAGVA